MIVVSNCNRGVQPPVKRASCTVCIVIARVCWLLLSLQVQEGRWTPPSVVESVKKGAASVVASAKTGAAAAAGAAKGAAGGAAKAT